MARFGASLNVGQTTVGNADFVKAGGVTDPVNASTYTADKTAFEAALATLVADGASPTQAHVTAANSAYTTFKADLVSPPAAADVVLSYDASKVLTLTVLRHALLHLWKTVSSGNSLTP